MIRKRINCVFILPKICEFVFLFFISLFFRIVAASLRKLFGRSKKEDEIAQNVDDTVNRVEDVADDTTVKTRQLYTQTGEDIKGVARDAGKIMYLNSASVIFNLSNCSTQS